MNYTSPSVKYLRNEKYAHLFKITFEMLIFGHAKVAPLKYKKSITTTNPFLKILNGSGSKLNQMWVYLRSGFYNRSKES